MKKIFIYTITWCLSYTVSDPCPDAGRKDEFGRTYGITCAVYHYHTVLDCDSKSKMFVHRDSAIIFLNKATDDHYGFINGRITNLKIDSTEIKQP